MRIDGDFNVQIGNHSKRLVVSGNFNESLLRKAANIAESFNRSNTNSTAGASIDLLKFNSK